MTTTLKTRRREPERFAPKSIAAAVAVALTLNATPARAGCCDDFWSCVGAVLTAGLSCAVEAAISEITDFVNDMKFLRSDLSKQKNGLVDAERNADAAERADWIAQVQGPVNALAALAPQAQAAQTVLPDLSGMNFGGGNSGTVNPAAAKTLAPAISGGASSQSTTEMLLKMPADLEATKTLLARSAKAVSALAQTPHAQNVNNQANAAKSASDARLAKFSGEFNSYVLAALDSLIALFAVADPIALVAAVAVANNELNEIQSRADAQFNQFAQGDSNAEINARNAAYAAINAAHQDAARAAAIVEWMVKLRQEPLRWEYQKLEELVGPNPPVIKSTLAVKQAVGGGGGGGTVTTLKQTTATKLTALRGKLTQLRSRPSPMATPVLQSRLDQQFSGRYAGKTGAAALKQREDLKAEAMARFRDPAQRTTALKLIDDDAARRGVR